MNDILSGLNKHAYYFAESFMYADSGLATGVATGAIAEPTWVTSIRTQDKEPVIGTPKVSLLTTYSIEDMTKTLLVCNIHALNRANLESYTAQLRDIQRAMSAHVGPIIFAGDFNTNSQTEYDALWSIVSELGLQEIVFSNESPTRSRITGVPLDHVFVRDLRKISASVVNSMAGSDHKALVVSLEIRE